MKKLTVLKGFGFLLFLFSTILPFMSTVLGPDLWPSTWRYSYYWSFASFTKSHIPSQSNPYMYHTSLLPDYWLHEDILGPGLLFMFVFQILTLLATVTSSFLRGDRRLRVIPPVVCSVVTVSMTYLGTILPMLGYYPLQPTYELGFWLVFPSLFLFLTVFILEHRNATNPNIFTLPKNADSISNTKEAQ